MDARSATSQHSRQFAYALSKEGNDVDPSCETAPDSHSGTVANLISYRHRTALSARRAQREAAHLILEIREVLALLDRGELDLDHAACLLHRLGGSLGAMAVRGELVAV